MANHLKNKPPPHRDNGNCSSGSDTPYTPKLCVGLLNGMSRENNKLIIIGFYFFFLTRNGKSTILF